MSGSAFGHVDLSKARALQAGHHTKGEAGLMAQQRCGVALIGAGMIAKTHVAALSCAQSVAQLRTIVSTRPGRARYLAEYYDGPR